VLTLELAAAAEKSLCACAGKPHFDGFCAFCARGWPLHSVAGEMRRRRQLSNRILASVVLILVLSTVVGAVLQTVRHRAQLEREYQQRALAIAQTFAAMPTVRAALARHDAADRREIQALASQVRTETGATYIVVIDRHGVRYSHPDPALIGHRISEPVVALDGRNHLGVDYGKLGPSASARTPLRGPDGSIIGEVSAGIQEHRVSDEVLNQLPGTVLYFAIALGIGVVASITLARRLKRSTFGLELDEIAALVQEREAMLHSIRDGVITLDRKDRVTLVNDEAARLLRLGQVNGRRIDELVAPGRLRDLLGSSESVVDQVVLTDEYVLVVNRMTVVRDGRELGAVITVRDRTELEGLVRELDGVEALTNALRAQQHEFSNRMHTVAGLIELGDRDGAVRYAMDVSDASGGLAEIIREQIERPELAAMLLAKTTIAAERHVVLTLTRDSRLADTGTDAAALVTIIGNLIDNAIDAAASGPDPAWVTVRLVADDDTIAIDVTDSGPGVPAELRQAVFGDGFTTKAEHDRQHGLGLALVHRLVRRQGGEVWIDARNPAVFHVTLPIRRSQELPART
jgi:two-component system, CitB family, sensor kinase